MKILIKNLTKIYGEKSSAVVALSELDLVIKENEICIVRGPNGSGKTTLISILSGELLQSAGEVIRIESGSEEPKIAVINQFNNLINELTVAEHFDLLKRTENKELISAELMNKKPTEISRGQSQIIAIALALSSDTDLLLADEPTGALSHEDSAIVYSFIKSTAIKNKSAVLLVTHDEAAEQIADRVVRLRDGRISETWIPGQSEKQVLGSNGWIKLPDTVAEGLAPAVEVSYSPEGASIQGRIFEPNIKITQFSKRHSTNQVLLTCENLMTKYGDQVVSRNINFKVRENEIFAVLGKSGSGKTTLLKSLAGLHNDYEGKFVNEKFSTIPYFNLENMFALELTLSELSVSTNLITKLNLEKLSDRPISTFSGGQKQRALVAIALSNPAQLILLDEPTSALDQDMTELVLTSILDSDKAVIIATHDDRIVQIANSSIKL